MTDYYIDAANGSNANGGTSVTDAWADFSPVDSYDNPAVSLGPGDTIYLRDTEVIRSTSADLRAWDGTASDPITVTNYGDESPVVDFTGETTGVNLTGNEYITVENLTVRNADEDNINIRNGARGHVVRNVVTHGHGQGGTTGHGVEIRDSSDILVKDVEAFDGSSGGNSDGFLMGDGSSDITFDGCIAHHNSDDGWDMKGKDGNDPGTGTLVDCIAYRNGANLDGSAVGNGVGFKCGNVSYDGDGGHTYIRCVAFENDHFGFDGADADVALTYWNCTSVRNRKHNWFVDGKADHEWVNCIAQECQNETDVNIDRGTVTTCNWDGIGSMDGTAVQFLSDDPESADFMRLPDGSRAIDAGTDVGLPYDGTAPDWGAFEYGGTTATTGSAVLRVYTGNDWKRAPAHYYDGNEFVSL